MKMNWKWYLTLLYYYIMIIIINTKKIINIKIWLESKWTYYKIVFKGAFKDASNLSSKTSLL
jgi:hypothetical protein